MGKGSQPIVGFHYRVAYHHGLTTGPIDAFLEKRVGDRTAWRGRVTASSTIVVNAPYLLGGEKDQGGVVGSMDVMFGEPLQAVNPYLVATFGDKTPAWRGFTTVVWKGGRYGAMNPYPKPASYKIERILQGWDSGSCWYPEKAAIPLSSSADVLSGYFFVAAGSGVNADGTEAATWGSFTSDFVGTANEIATRCFDLRAENGGGEFTFAQSFISGTEGAYSIGGTSEEHGPGVGIAGVRVTPVCPTGYAISFEEGGEGSLGTTNPSVVCTQSLSANAINPAHVLYDSRTCMDMGREPTTNINEASLLAAADKLYAEGFGICPKWDPASESVEDFEARICRLIGGSFTRSLEDGQWYLDLARGDYVLADLPILGDDDVLQFEEQPSTLDSAVNSVSVRYFDPQRKEFIVTPPVRALGLVAAFGTIHETVDFPEIPTGSLATRVALRILLERTTPTRVFDLVTTRRTRAWRPNTYFRLQTTKRGIADMVCVVGEKDSGTLKSGAIKMKATQEPSSLPDASFVEVEPGVDPTPSQTPTPITVRRAIEAPYLEIVANLSRADMAALPDDAGFAMAVATTSSTDLDYSMFVAPDGGSYEEVGHGEWCATATVVEAAPLNGAPGTAFTLAAGTRLDQVEVGMPVLWDDEVCRVDAIDATADPAPVVLGRGCGDTVPQEHRAGSRLWFYQTSFAYDRTEYTDGETITVKLLSNTGSQQQPETTAPTTSLTFDQRQARPYPPAGLNFTDTLVTDAAYPASLVGAITTEWTHRDRVLQADQLLDTTEASVGPEAGTTYTVTYEQPPGSVVHTQSAIAGTAATPYTFPTDGPARVAVSAVRDGLASWQALDHAFDYFASPSDPLVTEAGDYFVTETGDRLVTG